MSESYEQLRAALQHRTAFVFLDVEPPRDAPTKQFVASLLERAPGAERPQGQAVRVAITPEQARELLATGAEWKGPAHMRAEVLPSTDHRAG